MNITTHVTHVDWLKEYGYDVFTWDYAGYGKSEGSPSLSGILEQSREVLAYAANLCADLDLIVIGQSLGGTFATSALATSDVIAKALVLDCVFSSPIDIAAAKLSKDNKLLKWCARTALGVFLPRDISIEATIEKVGCPILFLHGKRDQVVPLDLGRRAYRKVIHRTDSDFLEFETGHCEVFRGDFERVKLEVLRWID